MGSSELVEMAGKENIEPHSPFAGFDVKLPIDATLTSENRLLYPLNWANAPASWVQTLGNALAPLVPRLRLSSRIAAGDLTHDERAADT